MAQCADAAKTAALGASRSVALADRLAEDESHRFLARQCGLDQFHRSLRDGDFDNQFVVPFVLQFNHDRVLRIMNIPENSLAVLIEGASRSAL
jgi:hypothetical protein